MELKCKETYHSGLCSLYQGDTTDGRGIPEEVKAQMLADFPDLFEVIGGKAAPVKKAEVVETVEVSVPEDKLEVENQEDKMPKTRKK